MSEELLCKLIEVDHNRLQDYVSDPLVICPKQFLSKVAGPIINRTFEERNKDDNKTPNSNIDEWFPFCNSYYNHSEQVDAFARTNHLLGLRTPSFASTSYKDETEKREKKFCYSTRQAQIEYLSSNPVSFLILGKPSIGEEELGKQLADYWQCVYIDPETLVKEEISSGSHSGQCIEFNLRSGRAIGIDVILRLVKKRVQTQSVLHRGFVLCGLPVIPNNLYEEDPVSSESAVFTVKEIFEEITQDVFGIFNNSEINVVHPSPIMRDDSDDDMNLSISRVEFGEPQYSDYQTQNLQEKPRSEKQTQQRTPVNLMSDLGDSHMNVCEPPEIGTNYQDQLNLIMSLYKGPLMIIYMVCENQDVIDRRQNYRYDIYSQSVIDLLMEKTEKNLLSLFPHKHQLRFGGLSAIDEIFEDVDAFPKDSSKLIHLVKLPKDFPAHVQTQLQNFQDVVVELFESIILKHDPEFYLKVDGRTSVKRIFNSVKWKLRTLNVQKVILPQRVITNDTAEIEGEESDGSKTKNYENIEECFRDFSRRNIVSPMFQLEYSDWGSHCPVAMAEGTFIDGDPAYAVQFMNYLFFLSSQEAFLKFYRNPRPYLLPPNPRSHGKIYVVGPPCSGKTAVSTCLAHLLKVAILSPVKLYKEFEDLKRENLIERMRQIMITDKLNSLNAELLREYQLEKMIVSDKISIWLTKFHNYVQSEVSKKSRSNMNLELSSFPVLLGSKNNAEELENEVQFEDIFLTEDKAKDLLGHPEKMKLYLPEELRTEVKEFVPITVLDEDTLEAIEEGARSADLDEIILGEEDLLDMFSMAIKQEEMKYLEVEKCKGGWIIDGISYDINFFQRVYDESPPEHVIFLEDSSNGEFLVDRFKIRSCNIFTDYKNFFRSIGKPDIADSIEEGAHELSKEKIAQDILGDILSQRNFLVRSTDPEDVTEEALQGRRESQISYKNELNQFEEAKENILNFLESMNKDVLRVDVNNKSLMELMTEVILSFEDRYRSSAVIFSDHDRLQEARDFGYNADVEGAGENLDLKGQEDFEANRRYGDTFTFCPVTFHDKGVLWKGRKDQVAKFQGKLYFCSSTEDLEAFVKKPWTYLPINKPYSSFPPPRICVIGHSKGGKTSVSKFLLKNFAICYFDFMEYLMGKGGEDENNENYLNIQEYLQTDTPLREELLVEFLYPLWFEEPYKTMGFVIDDFPKRPSDVTFMRNHKTIPDIIISLKVPKKELYGRTLKLEMDKWKFGVEEARNKRSEENLEVLGKWQEARRERYAQLIEEKRQQRYSQKKQREEEYQNVTEDTDGSSTQVTFDSVAEQEDIEEVNRLLAVEMPEPIFDVVNENITDVLENIKTDFKKRYSKEAEILKYTKELILAAHIPLKELKSEKNLDLMQYSAILAVDPYKFRNSSLLERTYDVSIEVAERLLASGYYFLSMFGRTCPVQYHKQDLKIQIFIPMEQQFNVFPIIHRQFIYFLIGKEARDLFRVDPLKFVDIENFKFPLLPIRVSVIGPPKCGKTALAERFRTNLGFKVVSKGQAARYVLNYLPFSSLGVSIEDRLRAGLELKEKMVLSCVEATTYDPRAVTQGILMDGFPNSPKEVKYLTSMGLMPQLVIDLYTNDEKTYEYVSTEASKIFAPPYSKHFMEHRYKIWEDDQESYRCWLDREFQNAVRVSIDTSMWDIWEKVFDVVKAAVYEIRHYFIHCKDDWPLRLFNMLVTPLEFLERESSYKTFCPCCLYHSNKLTCGGFPPDRAGLIHFRKYFYYVCPEHVEEFLDFPTQFLPPYNPNKLPPELPKQVILHEIPENVIQSGFCVVCSKDHSKSMKGSLRFAVSFRDYVYLFDSVECKATFIQSPMLYFDVEVTPKVDVEHHISLSYKDLPTLGALEQYVAKDVIKALKPTAAFRPVLPGLSVQQSALLSVGLHLKVNNEKYSTESREPYKNALDLMMQRRNGLLRYLETFRRYRNPFVYYEEPMPALKITDWIKEKFGGNVPAWSYTEIHPDKAFTKDDDEELDQ